MKLSPVAIVSVCALLAATVASASIFRTIIVTPRNLQTLNRQFVVSLEGPIAAPQLADSSEHFRARRLEIGGASAWGRLPEYKFTISTAPEKDTQVHTSYHAALRIIRGGELWASTRLVPLHKGLGVAFECTVTDSLLAESEVYFLQVYKGYPSAIIWVFPMAQFVGPANKRLQRTVAE